MRTKMKSVLALASMAFLGTFAMLATATTALAAVDCNPSNPTPSVWPDSARVQTCYDSSVYTPLYPNHTRDTVEAIGLLTIDAAFRLRSLPAPGGQTVKLRIIHSSLAGGYKDVQVVTDSAGTDSAVTIAQKLVDQIYLDVDLPFYVSAYASADVVFLYTLASGTTYDHVDSADVDISINSIGSGEYAALVSTPDRDDITWYHFGTQPNHVNAVPPEGPTLKPGGNYDSTAGVTIYEEFRTAPAVNEKSTSVWEEDGNAHYINTIKHTVAHETSHGLDHLYAAHAGFNQTTEHNAFYSDSSEFQAALAHDLSYVTNAPLCTFEAKDQYDIYASSQGGESFSEGGLPGVFTGFRDSDGDFICATLPGEFGGGQGRNLSTKWSGKSGLDILYGSLINPLDDPLTGARDGSTAAYPRLQIDQNEMFAEIGSTVLGFSDDFNNDGNPIYGSSQAFFDISGQLFSCTKLHVNSLFIYGRVPTANELATTGHIIPEGSGAVKGPGANFYPCDGSGPYYIYYGFGV